MNPYNFAVLLFAFCSFFVSVLIWLKRGDQIARIYFIFSTFVTIWGILWAILLSQQISYELALICSRLSHADAAVISTLWLHLTVVITNQRPYPKRLMFILYLSTVVICLLTFSPYFIPSVGQAAGFKYYTKAGPVFHVFMFVYWIGVIAGFCQLYKKMVRSTGEEKVQYKGFFVATLFGFIGGSLNQAPIYGLNFPQYNLFLTPIYPFVMAYFMIRHRLFDVEQVIEAFQREKLATIGLLAASVNHEIRNPLYIAKSALESYIEGEEEKLGKKEPLETSKKSLAAINRALDVIGKLNRFAKPTNENAELNAQASIPEAIQTVLDLVSHEFELDKIHIQNLVPESCPKVKADQRHLEEIFFNLIVNACHAMGRAGGELVISASCHSREGGNPDPRRADRVVPDDRAADRRLTNWRLKHPGMTDKVGITIQDTGTGIPPEQTKHLFEPFHTTKGDKGTGLGLYITKQLVERNNGKISVQSQEGKGTSFALEFKEIGHENQD